MNFVELFCGKGEVTKQFKCAGYNTWNTDNRKRRGICEPDVQLDILKLRRHNIPFENVHVLWASIPCTAFSFSAGAFYYDKRTPKQTALYFLKVLNKSLELILEIRPGIYFIENPRGKLRYEKAMIDFFAKTNGVIKEIHLGSYGFPTTKPTDIFTNAHDFQGRDKLPWGRGAKNISGRKLDSFTKCSKQATPEQLAKDVVSYCSNVLNHQEEEQLFDEG